VRSLFPKTKSRLPPQQKAVVAAFALLDTLEGRIDETAAGQRLREQVGLNWSFITCLQYLSGQEALSALRALPDDWSQDGRAKRDLTAAALLAAHTVANIRPGGEMLCASHLADELKGKDLVDWVKSSRQQL
jgi:hypothetical protein